jgi:hypothetical protein
MAKEQVVTEIVDKKQLEKSGYDTALHPDLAKTDSPKAQVTLRTCKAVVVNNFDNRAITKVTLRHRYRNDPGQEQKHTWDKLTFGQTSDPPLNVTYFTGFGAGHDYWWIQFFDANGNKWECKDNFYCDLRDEDEGITVLAILNGSNDKMELIMNSPSCEVSLSIA